MMKRSLIAIVAVVLVGCASPSVNEADQGARDRHPAGVVRGEADARAHSLLLKLRGVLEGDLLARPQALQDYLGFEVQNVGQASSADTAARGAAPLGMTAYFSSTIDVRGPSLTLLWIGSPNGRIRREQVVEVLGGPAEVSQVMGFHGPLLTRDIYFIGDRSNRLAIEYETKTNDVSQIVLSRAR